LGVQQERDGQRPTDRDRHEEHGVDDGAADGVAELRVVRELPVVREAGPGRRRQQVVVLEREQHHPADRDDPEQNDQGGRRQDEDPAGEVLGAEDAAAGPHPPCASTWFTWAAAWSRACFGWAFPSSTAWIAWPIACEISL